jgi:hypothetical protein
MANKIGVDGLLGFFAILQETYSIETDSRYFSIGGIQNLSDVC